MNYTLPLEQFLNRVENNPGQLYLSQPIDDQWIEFSWQKVDEMARRIAQGLIAHGLQKGDRVAILAKNSAEWVIVDIAAMMAGMVSVPIYDTAGVDTIRYILEHSEAKAVFVGKLQDYEPVRQALNGQISIGFPYTGVEATEKWSDWLEDFRPLHELHQPEADEMATLVYTSGSEGLPKGVKLTHRNLAAAGTATVNALPPELRQSLQRQLSYLPMAHITERASVTIASFYFPLSIYFVDSLDTFIENIRYVKPTIFLSVPRLWVKFQASVLAKIPQKKLQLLLKIPLLSRIVAARIRRELGLAEARLFLCGSAPIAIETLRWYQKIGVNISEGWGMTETTGAACVNMPFKPGLLGTIGKPMQSVEMKLSDSGEILIRGDGVFSEYYNDADKTDAAFDAGWFKTGDCGELTHEGAWRITGRVKEQFKTSKGKFVAPVPIERLLAINSHIEQVCVVGEGRKQPVALLVLNENISERNEQTERELLTTLEKVNSQLEHHANLDALIVAREPWTIENQLLTPTLKLRRKEIEKKYHSLIHSTMSEKVIWE